GDGGGVPYPDSSTLLLRPDRRRSQYSACRDAAQHSDPGIVEAVGRLSCPVAKDKDRMAGRLCHSLKRAGAGRGTRRGCVRDASLYGQSAAAVNGADPAPSLSKETLQFQMLMTNHGINLQSFCFESSTTKP